MALKRNRVIVVTSVCQRETKRVYGEAIDIIRGEPALKDKELNALISPLSPPAWNGQRTFTVLAEGSDPGTPEGEAIHGCRDAIRSMLSDSGVAWVELQMGEERWAPIYITHDSARLRMMIEQR